MTKLLIESAIRSEIADALFAGFGGVMYGVCGSDCVCAGSGKPTARR
jgi:hypothetical protein